MIRSIKSMMESIPISPEFTENPQVWVTKQAQTNGLRWLLVHADDGVIWGEVRGDGLHLSTQLCGPILREQTLQTARLFGETGELFVWRSEKGWQARFLTDECEMGEFIDFYDESHLLWGVVEEKRADGFLLLSEGSEGLCHAIPIPQSDVSVPLGLNIRQYVKYDDDGQAFVAYSRLVGINCIKQEGR